MKKILLFALFSIALASCDTTKSGNDATPERRNAIELLYFHGPQSCSSCTTIENIANSVLESYTDELECGRLIYSKVDLVENESLSAKYGIVWSSLLIVSYDDDGNEEVIDLSDKAYTYIMSDATKLYGELRSQLDVLLKK